MAKRGRKPKDKNILLNMDSFDFRDKKGAFMRFFAMQDRNVRSDILKDLPALHALLSLESESFEEMALRQIATARGEKYDKDKPPRPDCPNCKNHDSVVKKTGYMFRCTACGKTFSANYNSISSGTKQDALTWMKVFQGILNFRTVSQICEFCGIEKATFYRIRNRLFYAIQLLMADLKIYGTIEVDISFIRASYRGRSLSAPDYTENSVFYEYPFVPRPSRKRGEANSFAERSINTLAIFTAIDDRGHVFCRFAGNGAVSARALNTYIPADKFLLEVPEKDPFSDFIKAQKNEAKTKPGNKSLMVADKEAAIEKYAKLLNINFESHVYRKDGVQRKLAEGSHDIQRVNALHSRLKKFIRDVNYCSSHFLPGYLLLFELIQNTGATDDVVARIFQILATPDLGKPASFYEELFVVPNYLLDWLNRDDPVKKLPYKKVLAFYMYDHIRNQVQYPGIEMTMKQIEMETGYTAPSIRKIYKDLNGAGYRDLILEYFGEPSADMNSTQKGGKKYKKDKEKNRAAMSPTSVNPTVLAIYDEYVKIRQLPIGQRPRMEDWLKEINQQFGTNYKRANMLMKFKIIEECGLRSPLPELNKEKDPNTYPALKRALDVRSEYEAIKLSYRERGEQPPKRDRIIEQLAAKYGVKEGTIVTDLNIALNYLKTHEK